MISEVRLTLAVIVMSAVMVFLTLYGAFTEQTVHQCSAKEKNPPDVQQLCKRLTRGQWWHQ